MEEDKSSSWEILIAILIAFLLAHIYITTI